MGNKISNNVIPEVHNSIECIICLEEFSHDNELHVQCLICKKYTHRQCFHKYLESAGLTYCKCAYCRKIGTSVSEFVY